MENPKIKELIKIKSRLETKINMAVEAVKSMNDLFLIENTINSAIVDQNEKNARVKAEDSKIAKRKK